MNLRLIYEKSQIPVCYYVKNDILMRKWRPPDVSAEMMSGLLIPRL